METLFFSPLFHNAPSRGKRESVSLSLLSPVLPSRSSLRMAIPQKLKLIGGVALVAWAAGLQVRKRYGVGRLASLFLFCPLRLFSSTSTSTSPRNKNLRRHQLPFRTKIHIWHLQSQPEFKERVPDVRDPEETEKKS